MIEGSSLLRLCECDGRHRTLLPKYVVKEKRTERCSKRDIIRQTIIRGIQLKAAQGIIEMQG